MSANRFKKTTKNPWQKIPIRIPDLGYDYGNSIWAIELIRKDALINPPHLPVLPLSVFEFIYLILGDRSAAYVVTWGEVGAGMPPGTDVAREGQRMWVEEPRHMLGHNDIIANKKCITHGFSEVWNVLGKRRLREILCSWKRSHNLWHKQ